MKFSNISLVLLIGCLFVMACKTKSEQPNPTEQNRSETTAVVTDDITLDDFSWLQGSFKRLNTEPGVISMEMWTRKNENEYEGLAISINQGQQTISEVMNLQMKEKQMVVKHGDTPPVIFKLTGYDESSFTVENAENDFPKKIVYKKSDQGMNATISGGGPAIEFIFQSTRPMQTVQWSMALKILYEDQQLIAINKPHGLLVHRSPIAKDAQSFALQMVRDQIGQRVHLAHRLDRKTAGVLLLVKNKEALKDLSQLFQEKSVKKTYNAIIRGHLTTHGVLDYPLEHNGKHQEATTIYKPMSYFEIPYSSGRYPTSRYTLVSLHPLTGRFHQLRKHMAHLRYPIIGDRPHGCNKQNRLWKNQLNMDTMLLHASSITFSYKEKEHTIEAPYRMEFEKVLSFLKKHNLSTSKM